MDEIVGRIRKNQLELSGDDFEISATDRAVTLKMPYVQFNRLCDLVADSNVIVTVMCTPEIPVVTVVIEYAPVSSSDRATLFNINTKFKDSALSNILSQIQFIEPPTVDVKEAVNAAYIRCISSASCSGALHHTSVTIFRIDPIGIYISTDTILMRNRKRRHAEEDHPLYKRAKLI